MNWTQIEGKWDQLKGDVKSNWGKLTDDDVKVIGGRMDNLVGKLVERYGVKKDQARLQIDQWTTHLGDRIDAVGRPAQVSSADGRQSDSKRIERS